MHPYCYERRRIDGAKLVHRLWRTRREDHLAKSDPPGRILPRQRTQREENVQPRRRQREGGARPETARSARREAKESVAGEDGGADPAEEEDAARGECAA
jgi:hypothetical protein